MGLVIYVSILNVQDKVVNMWCQNLDILTYKIDKADDLLKR